MEHLQQRNTVDMHPSNGKLVNGNALGGTPYTIGQNGWLVFRPNDGTFATIFGPNACRPIANSEEVLQKVWIAGNRIHGTKMGHHLK